MCCTEPFARLENVIYKDFEHNFERDTFTVRPTELMEGRGTRSDGTVCCHSLVRSESPILQLVAALLVDVVVHHLLDEVHVGEHHTAAAVARHVQCVKHLLLAHVALQHLQVPLPLVPNDLAA
eukprot:gnl/TRDRNA2_/TRDRNA2_183429_c0_seq1.p1 gnl/TRDRNA2_/TRDRNA2_183429_c0~~gnl/TRDRNA2_/TRDRNA2_183429_c0_seq1.p1  ORF type:complete len:123 (+),score=1.17 gnl/TRDRNA2_/TRDRNA2_183429_c0_seq1:96-464(+)